MSSTSWCLLAAISAFGIIACVVGCKDRTRRGEQHRKMHFRNPTTAYPTKKAMKDQKYIDQYNKGMHGRGKRQTTNPTMAQLVPSFDWRHMGSTCQSLIDVRTGRCPDSRTVAGVNSISDRYCLVTGENKFFSEWNVVGCQGFYRSAIDFYVQSGVTTGGDPRSSIPEPSGCFPSIDDCDINKFWCPQLTCQTMNHANSSTVQWISSDCTGVCTDNTPLVFYYGNSSNTIYPGDDMQAYINATMWEVFHHGPGIVKMMVYDDLSDAFPPDSPIDVTATYTGPKPGSELVESEHGVRLIGWGTDENGTDYWTIMNHWGTGWGNNGTLNIKRGIKNYWGVDQFGFEYAYPQEMFV